MLLLFIFLTLIIAAPIITVIYAVNQKAAIGAAVAWVLLYGAWWLSVEAKNNEWFLTVEAPKSIEFKITDSIFSSSDFNEITSSGDETRILLTDGKSANSSENYDSTPGITVSVTNENANLKKAGLAFTIANDNMTSDKNSIPGGKDIPYGETTYTIIAKNSAGELQKTLVITKLTTSDACAKYDPDNTREACRSFQEKAEKDAKHAEFMNSWDTSNSTSAGATSCLHYEQGKCWDDVESAGYNDGYWDGINGTYNGNYFDSLGTDNCNQFCEDVYEDAYQEGYADARAGH